MKLWIITGFLSLGLVHTALSQEGRIPPGPPHEEMFQSMDTDGDSSVTASEFQAFQDKQFDAMDTNGNGKLTSAEMKAAFEKKGKRFRGRMDRDNSRDDVEEEAQDTD